MNVLTDWLPLWELSSDSDWVLVIKFNQGNRAVYPIIKYRIVIGWASPGKIGVIPMFFDFTHADFCMPIIHVASIEADYFEQCLSLLVVQFTNGYAFVGYDGVIFPGFRLVIVAWFGMSNDRLRLLLWSQALSKS